MSAFLELVQFPYGLPELKANYRKYLLRGLVIGIILNLSLVGAYWGTVYLDKDEPPMWVVRIIKYSELGPPPDFVPFEKAPAVIKRVDPLYPELARKAGMEGRVIVKVWIDRKGKVKDVVILKGATEVLNEAAIKAAKQWEFTPAMMKHGPVDVWSTLTFNFKLSNPDT